MRKRLYLSACLIIFIFLAFSAIAFAGSRIQLLVNGKVIEADVSPQLINNRTMVPIRWVAEAFGAKVEWDQTSCQQRLNFDPFWRLNSDPPLV